MDNFFQRTLKGDKIVWAVYATMVLISIVSMFSASSYLVSMSGSISGPILRHVFFHVIGFGVILIVQLVDFKKMKLAGYVGLVASIALLVFTMLFGVEQAGAARFINVGGFQFQPSEFAKVSLILVIANQIEFMQDTQYQRKFYWWVILVVGVVCGLIFLENLSTSGILFITVMVMMWIGSVSWKKLFVTVAIVVSFVVAIIGVAALIPEDVYRESDNKVLGLFERAYTWVARLENFGKDNDEENKYVITDSNYQVSHAQIAIARGGFTPHMPGSSQQTNFLPEAFSDFIFSIIVEEGGFFAGLLVMLLYLILLFRAGLVARKSTSLFGAVLVIGVTMLIVFQAAIHIAVSVHLIPVTGQPLPLISRGGTSTLTNCFYFGVIINVTNYINRTYEERQSQKTKVADNPTTTQ